MSDILFIKTSSLGDVIHQMPALTEARQRLPQARFSWVVEEAFAPLVRLHPAVSDVIPVATRRWRQALFWPVNWRDMARFTSALRTSRYDEIIDTQGLFRSALLARVARGRRHGYDSGSVRERAAAALYDVRHRVPRDLHAIERNRRLTALALGYQPEGGVDFGLNRARLAPAADGYGILLHATARAEKEWPEDRWMALGEALGSSTRSLVLPWGSDTERTRSVRIAAALGNARVPERQSLDRVAALIAGASFVVGVDTGLLHLAAALGVPLVAIFLGSEPALTGPIGAGPMAVVGGKDRLPSVDEVFDALGRVA
ncbi:MAG: lipopolysaccharide heptosyltransferase I [Pseudorhodoplanes sp.]